MSKSSRRESNESAGKGAGASAQTPGWMDPGLARSQLQAQGRYEQALREAQMQFQRELLEAQRDCAASLQEAQRDLESFASEAYQNYLAALTDANAATPASERGAEAYEELLRSTAELSTQGLFGRVMQEAYQELLAGVAAAKSPQMAPAVDGTELYRRYVDRINDGWKQAQDIQGRAEQAYAACIDAWKEAIEQRRRDTTAAYQTYVDGLKEAYARSDLEGRAAAAAKAYATAAEEAWRRAQAAYSDAVIALVNAGRSVAEGAEAPAPA